MKLKVHYKINGLKISYILEGETIANVREKNTVEMNKRGLKEKTNKCWSEVVE